MNRPDFASYATSVLSYYRVLFLIISKSMLILVSSLIAKIYFKYSLKRYAVVLFYLGESVILLYMIIRTLSNANIDVFLLWVSLFLLNMIGIYAAAQHSWPTWKKKEVLRKRRKIGLWQRITDYS